MTTLRTAVKELLEADAMLSALLTGGVLDADDLPRDGGGVDYAPRDATGVRIAPFAVLRWKQSTPFDSQHVRAEKQTLEVYLYADSGYSTIESAANRVKSILHQSQVNGDDRSLVTVLYVYQSSELVADELNQCPMQFQRYEVSYVR